MPKNKNKRKQIGSNFDLTSYSLIRAIKLFQYALVIARFRVQNGQYFPSFSYFTDLTRNEETNKNEKQGKYWPYCVR